MRNSLSREPREFVVALGLIGILGPAVKFTTLPPRTQVISYRRQRGTPDRTDELSRLGQFVACSKADLDI